jgi:hypothetical protein
MELVTENGSRCRKKLLVFGKTFGENRTAALENLRVEKGERRGKEEVDE